MTFLTMQQEVASRLRLLTTNSDQLTLVKRWINQAQQEIWSRYDWPWALDREIVQTVIDKTAGTVTVTAASTTVTGTSTAFGSADVGKFIQFSSTDDWYKITAVASTTSLTIEKDYVGTTTLTAGTYTIRQFFYSASSSAEKILSVHQTISPSFVRMIHYREFDIFRPNPSATGGPNLIVVYGYDSSNNLRFTPYPFPDVAMNLEMRTKKVATDLSADSDVSVIPAKWHSTVMIDGALYRGIEYISIGNPQPQDTRASVARRNFNAGIAQMMGECEPDAGNHPVLMNRETLNLPYGFYGPVLPDKYGV